MEVEGDVLRIGRGTRAALRSDNPATSLDHATISRDDAGYTLTDLGSITGTYVNGKPVESARLKKGDIIEIGDLRLEVQSTDPRQPLFLRLSKASMQGGDVEDEVATPAVAAPGIKALKAPKVDFAAAFRLKRPYLTKLTLAAILGIACVAVVGEVTKPRNQAFFAPGGVSSAHARARDPRGIPIAIDCQSCHVPFGGVTNARCEACHGRMEHAANQLSPPPCTDCHAEHRGATRLAAVPDRLCVDCHGNIIAHMKRGRRVANIMSLGAGHPDFTYPPDADTLRFNHRLHLHPRGVFNGQGVREVLTCTSCHHMIATGGRIDPAPVRFDRDCRRCHRLTFDPRFRDVEVPHGGDPGLVYGFILATYAGNRDIAGKPPEEVRRILTQQKQNTSDQRALLGAEQVIKVKCSLCHEVRRANGRLTATPPVIPTRWLAAKFSHGPHRNVGCEECHAQARNSATTSDVLLPQRRVCLDCHGERPITLASTGTRRTNDCGLCHEYHVRSTAVSARVSAQRAGSTRADMGGDRRMFEATLVALIVVLLVVVLLPVGIALYQRMRPAPPSRSSERGPSPQPPPSPPSPPAGSTSRVPALTPDAAAAPPPPPAPPRPETPPPATPARQSAGEPTRMIALDQARGGAAPSATEAVTWYGLLRCTGGPLEGQAFVIEEDGLYIGRDPSMARIVIDDSRISKRHLRIVPRNGKVWAIDQSTNGTFLVSNTGRQRIAEHQLKRGDTLALADNVATFVYQI